MPEVLDCPGCKIISKEKRSCKDCQCAICALKSENCNLECDKEIIDSMS